MHRGAKRQLSVQFIIVLFVSVIFQGMAQAKELSNRLGVGYSDPFSVSMPSVAIRYYPDPKLGIGASIGVDTEEDNSKFGVMAKLYRILFTEDNMNFFMGAGAGLLSLEQNNESDSGFEMNAFCGGEFFFSGLESLGFTFEAGVGVTSINSAVRFRTIGDSPFKAGVTFYF